MRVTNQMIMDTLVSDLQGALKRLETVQRQLTTGKRISRPSDDPSGTGRALTYQASISASDQFTSTIGSGLDWLNASESNLSSATDALQRARELAVQAGNDTLTTQQQQALGENVNQLLQQMVQLGNASLRGQRLFAGFRVDADPFSLNAGPPTTVTFNGDSGVIEHEIDVGAKIAINVPGSTTFGSSFSALIQLRDDIQAGNTAAVRSHDLAAVDSALDDILNVRGEVGARINRLEMGRDRQAALKVGLQDQLAKTQETDFAEAATKYATAQALYQAALQSGAKAIQPSLLDYLR